MSWTHKYISASRLDNFAKYLSGYKYNFGDSYEEYSTEDFIDSLLNIQDPNKFLKANAGTAFHELIEHSNYEQIFTEAKVNDWKIIIDEDLDIEFAIPVVREAKIVGEIAGVVISSRVDAMDSVSIRDYKTTSKVDLETYMNSNQWKCYLALTGLNKFIYDVFKVNVDEEIKTVTIQEYHKLDLYAYPGMKQEVSNLVRHYHETLLILEPKIIARVHEYNNQITSLIDCLEANKSWALSAINIIDSTINLLKTKFIRIKGLTE